MAIKDAISTLGFEKYLSPEAVTLLESKENSLLAWEIVNMLCFVDAEEDRGLNSDDMRRAETITDLNMIDRELIRLANKYSSTALATNERKNHLFALRRLLLVTDNVPRTSRVVSQIRAQLANRTIPESLKKLDETLPPFESYEELFKILEENNFYGLHPLLAMILEKLIRKDVEKEETNQVRSLIWSEKIGVLFSTEGDQFEAELNSWLISLNALLEQNPEIKTQFQGQEEGSDEYYFALLDLLSRIDFETYQQTAKQLSNQKGNESLVAKLLWMVGQMNGEARVTEDEALMLAKHLISTPYAEILPIWSGDEVTIIYFLTTYKEILPSILEKKAAIEQAEAMRIKTEEEAAREYGDAFGKNGKLPSFEKAAFKRRLLKLRIWCQRNLDQKINGQFKGDDFISTAKVEEILECGQLDEWFVLLLDRALHNRTKNQQNEDKGKRSQKWTRNELEVIAIVLEYEKLKWGGGGIEQGKMEGFIKLLSAVSVSSDMSDDQDDLLEEVV